MKQVVQRIFRNIAWQNLDSLAARVVEDAIRIQQIPAPTFEEAQRAAFLAAEFERLDVQQVRQDDLHNVYGVIPGERRDIPGVLVMAHSDTVFPMETDLSIRRENGRVYGPGLGDNSLGVAGVLGLIHWLRDHAIVPGCDVHVVVPVCEEGLGDLKGIRAVWQQLQDQIGLVVNLEGLAYGHIYHAGIAVRRYHIQAFADGGHSWLHFGRASATHAIVQAGAHICKLKLPKHPRTTFNIGMLEGGQAINAISRSAGMWLDMRSESQAELDKLAQRVREIIEDMSTPDLRFSIDVVGNRPAGAVDPSHALVQGAVEALRLLSVRASLETGSTDGNVPLHAGCPTVTIGITRGGNAHRLDEYIETAPVRAGMQQLIALVLASAAYQQEQIRN